PTGGRRPASGRSVPLPRIPPKHSFHYRTFHAGGLRAFHGLFTGLPPHPADLRGLPRRPAGIEAVPGEAPGRARTPRGPRTTPSGTAGFYPGRRGPRGPRRELRGGDNAPAPWGHGPPETGRGSPTETCVEMTSTWPVPYGTIAAQ